MNTISHLHNTARRTNKLSYESLNFLSLFSPIDTVNDNLTLYSPSSNIPVDFRSLSDVDLSYTFLFWFNLAFHIPSVICYFFVFTFILTQKTQRQALHNHSVLVLLFIAFSIVLFDYSWSIDSCRREGKVWPATSVFCEVWWLLDFGFYDACTLVLAWASFERHILIFHSNLVATKRRLIFIHYLPLVIILIYLIIFYTYAIFFPPCQNEYDFTVPVCGAYPCFISHPFLPVWSTILHGIIPTFLIAFFNIALLVRVLWQKQRHHQDWRKCRKMAFQLLSISALYLSLNLPLMIIAFVQSIGFPEWGIQAQLYLFFFSGLVQYLLPFICLTYLVNIWHKMKTFFTRNHRRVIPVDTTRMTQRR